tara:strand:- start:1228 stop:1734 length:507 start_codon:yes stop_codon:yes gene_type:complete
MNKLLAAITAVVTLTTTTAFAQTEYATIVKVNPNYQTISVPVQHTECNIVEVPVYSSQGHASTGDTVLGAIIGGAVGNQFGGGRGNDAATVLGAIIGADIANKNSGQQQIIGYRQEKVCQNVTFYEKQEKLENYNITYEWNGIRGRAVTYNIYQVGDTIPVNISIQAK